MNEFTRPHIPLGIQDKKKVLDQGGNPKNFGIAPSAKDHANALGVRKNGDRSKAAQNCAPSQEDHADALGVRKREDNLNKTPPIDQMIHRYQPSKNTQLHLVLVNVKKV